jgi:hypothetical protein
LRASAKLAGLAKNTVKKEFRLFEGKALDG